MNPLATALGLIALAYVLSAFLMWYLAPTWRADRKAAVVVLGDIGHSPRMCFHAISIAGVGCPVDLIGYKESDLMLELSHPLINIVALPKPVRSGNYLVYAVKRVLSEHIALYRALRQSKPTVLLVQNPPSVPTLGVARIFTLWTSPGTKLLIDWHNLGYSILALTHRGLLVRLYHAYEMLFGQIAYLHLSVSIRLGMALKSNLRINPKRVIPLYDRPFKPRIVTDKMSGRRAFPYNATCAWIVTSTSYTPDEDIRMLLAALKTYTKGPRIVCVITGKGPMKAEIEAEIKDLSLPNAEVHTAWLSYDNYHRLLGVADLGISLHRSSSGWDLPMKVVDMFGAGLPVLALKYPALDELVKPENGLTFDDAASLTEGLAVLQDTWKLAELRKGALLEARDGWERQWREKLGPVFGYGQYTGEESSSSSDSD